MARRVSPTRLVCVPKVAQVAGLRPGGRRSRGEWPGLVRKASMARWASPSWQYAMPRLPSSWPSPWRSPISRWMASACSMKLDGTAGLAQQLVDVAQVAQRLALASTVADLALDGQRLLVITRWRGGSRPAPDRHCPGCPGRCPHPWRSPISRQWPVLARKARWRGGSRPKFGVGQAQVGQSTGFGRRSFSFLEISNASVQCFWAMRKSESRCTSHPGHSARRGACGE